MIPWVTTGNYLNGLLAYNERKEDDSVAKLLYVNNFDNNIETFKTQYRILTENSQREKNLMHISLNFHQDDRPVLTEEKYTEIAKEFLTEYGFPEDHPFLIYEHADKNHPHIHLVTPMFLDSGQPINDSFAARKMIKIARKLEEKHGITRVVKNQPKLGQPIPESLIQDYTEAKKGVDAAVQKVLRGKPVSFKDLEKMLKHNPVVYNGEECTVGYELSQRKNGVTFFLTNAGGAQVTKGVKGSSLTGKLSYGQMGEKFAFNKKIKDSRVFKVRSMVEAGLSSALSGDRSRGSFNLALEQAGITPNYFRKEDGEIFGVEFIDKYSNITYKGSDLHKSLSWNSLKNQLVADNEIETVTLKHEEIMSEQKWYSIKELKGKFNLVDMAIELGYQIDSKNRSTQKGLVLTKDKQAIVVYQNGAEGSNEGLFYTIPNTSIKGDVIQFLIDNKAASPYGIATDVKETVKMLNARLAAGGEGRVISTKETIRQPVNKEKKEFQPVSISSQNQQPSFIVQDRGVSIDVFDNSYFKDAIFTTDHTRFYEDMKMLYGAKNVHQFLDREKVPNSDYNVFPLFDVSKNDNSTVVGQMIRNKDFKHLVVNTDKQIGAWRSAPAGNSITVLEDPLDAVSKHLLNPTETTYYATIGNPSNNLVGLILDTVIGSHKNLILGGDNDAKGQEFNLNFLTRLIGKIQGIKMTYSKSDSEYRVVLQSDNKELLDLNYDKISMGKSNFQRFTGFEAGDKSVAVKFSKSVDEQKNTEILTSLMKNLTYLYGLEDVVSVSISKLKDFNDDLMAAKGIYKSNDIKSPKIR